VSKLGGQVAIVTGGARGLGRQFSLRLASLGAAVGVVDVDLRSFLETGEQPGAETVVEEIKAGGGAAAGVEADVRDPDAVASAVDGLAEELGDPSILVTCAGGSRGARPNDPASVSANKASEMSFEDMRWVMEANFYGTVYSVSAVVPYMKRRRFGKIVTVASVNGHTIRPDGSQAHYAAAKAAIIHYTRQLAAELGPYGIYANCLAPGLTTTDKNRGRYEGLSNVNDHVALRRLGVPEDQANALEFLATDASGYVTGITLDVSGGTRVAWWGPPPAAEGVAS
jgi:3-oxoacyl-[acyl-carrier protein] reductase